MKENKRIKLLKEETINEVTLQQLLDLAGKAEIAVMQLADNCMKFNSKSLKVASAEVKAKLSSLSDTIRNLIMGNEQESEQANEKQPLDQSQGSDSARLESEELMDESENLGTEIKPKMDELVKEARKIYRRIIEAAIIEDEDGELDTASAQKTMDAASSKASKEANGEKVIDLSEPFENAIAGLDDSEFQGFKSQVVDALKASGVTEPEFQSLVSDVEGAEDVDDFNFALDKVYDYADNENILVETEKKSKVKKK
jgi:hypothetical protein